MKYNSISGSNAPTTPQRQSQAKAKPRRMQTTAPWGSCRLDLYGESTKSGATTVTRSVCHRHRISSITIVFLECGGHSPAFDPRKIMLRAGDIEVNPGPGPGSRRQSAQNTQSLTCCACDVKIRSNITPLICTQDGCGKAVHKLSCTRISRYVKDPKW